jgi:hypothetical protein
MWQLASWQEANQRYVFLHPEQHRKKNPKKPPETVRRERGSALSIWRGEKQGSVEWIMLGDYTDTWLTMAVAERLGAQKGSIHIGRSPGKRLRWKWLCSVVIQMIVKCRPRTSRR